MLWEFWRDPTCAMLFQHALDRLVAFDFQIEIIPCFTIINNITNLYNWSSSIVVIRMIHSDRPEWPISMWIWVPPVLYMIICCMQYPQYWFSIIFDHRIPHRSVDWLRFRNNSSTDVHESDYFLTFKSIIRKNHGGSRVFDSPISKAIYERMDRTIQYKLEDGNININWKDLFRRKSNIIISKTISPLLGFKARSSMFYLPTNISSVCRFHCV